MISTKQYVVSFQGDFVGRTEDQIIARTWRLFVEEEVDDPEVNLLLPMTKVMTNFW